MNTKIFTQFITILTFCLLVGAVAQAQEQAGKNQIKFTRFYLTSNKKRITINWATDNTVATNYFEIQKSFDNKNFKTIALVLGPDPKQFSCDCYSCSDKYFSKNAKHSYYRLKHIDVNGIEQLSETKSLAKI